ncbi:MAG: DUF2240 family protein [Candidatus Diapherotrites archaeon]|nr:DUF2240 family protein [Candidatus Diapherotrites archaeon]
MEKEKIIEKIAKDKNINKKDIEKQIEDEIKKYFGLLNEDGALVLIAKRYGIDIKEFDYRKISELREGMQKINIKAKIKKIFPIKKINKNGKEYLLTNIILTDGKKEIKLKLWNDLAKKIEEEKIERNWLITATNLSVLNNNGEIELINNIDSNIEFQKIDSDVRKISEIKENEEDIDIYCKVNKILEEKKFKKDFREGKYVVLELTDINGDEKIRAIAWNDATEEIKKIREGSLIKIESAYTRNNNKKIEVHLGWKSRIIENPASQLQTQK